MPTSKMKYKTIILKLFSKVFFVNYFMRNVK